MWGSALSLRTVLACLLVMSAAVATDALTMSPVAGTYAGPLNIMVKLSVSALPAGTDATVMRYTTDGSDPITSATGANVPGQSGSIQINGTYGPVVLTGSCTVRVVLMAHVTAQTVYVTPVLTGSAAYTLMLSGLPTSLALDAGVASAPQALVLSGGTAPYTLAVISSNAALIPPANVVLAGSGTARQATVTSVAGGAGTASITITSTDSGGVVSFQSCAVTVNALPTIAGLATATQTDAGVATAALPFTPSNGTGGLVLAAASSNAALVPNANLVFGGSGSSRTITITPLAGQVGAAVITVTATDTLGQRATASLQLTVVAKPTLSTLPTPVVRDVGMAIPTMPFQVLGGTANGTPTVTSSNTTLLPAANLVVSGSGSTWTLTATPAAGKTGSANLTLKVVDGMAQTATQVVAVTVNPLPVLTKLPATIKLDQGVTSAAQTLALTGGTAPTTMAALSSDQTVVANADIRFAGTASAPTLTICPSGANPGTATISVTASDALGNTSTQACVATVYARPQVSGLPASVQTDAATAATVTFSYVSPDGTVPTFSAKTSNPTLLPASGCSFGTSGALRTLKLTPVSGQTGTATVTVVATDARGGTGEASIDLVVNALPTIEGLPTALGTDDGVATQPLYFVMANGTGSLVPTVTSSNTTLMPTANCQLQNTARGWALVVTPVAGKTGWGTITVKATDAIGKSASAAITLTVHAALKVTVAGSAMVTNAGQGIKLCTYTVSGGTDPITLSAVGNDGALVPADNCILNTAGDGTGSLWVTPVAGHSGTTTVLITVLDGAKSAVVAVSPALTVNNALAISGLPAVIETTLGAAPVVQPITVAGGTGTLGVTAASANTALAPAPTLAGSGSARTLTIAPVAGQTGSSVLTVTVTDSGSPAQVVTASCQLSVLGTAPVVRSRTWGCPAGISVFQRSIDATSPSGRSLAFTATQPAHGTVSLVQSPPSFAYTPVAGYTGADAFTITANDGQASGTGTIRLAVGAAPERSLLVSPRIFEGFDAAKWSSDAVYRNSYLREVLPARVWSTHAGDASTPMLEVVGPADLSVNAGGSVVIRAKAPAGAPVTFATAGNGSFAAKPAITVSADTSGQASTVFSAPLALSRCPILIGSPLAVGTQRVVVEVLP